jgi:hypothetical protein
MFLAVGGLAGLAPAADGRSGNSNYYAAGQNVYRISDEDDQPAAEPSVAQAVGQPQSNTYEQNALYVADGTATSGVLQTGFVTSNGSCGCGGGACGCNGGCGNSCGCDCSNNWFRLEYLGWFSRGRNTPPLVTSSAAGTDRADAGVLGLESTTILYGDDPIGTDIRSGLRATFTHLFADGCTAGTFRFWGLEDSSETFAINSGNRPIIAQPFFNTLLGIQDSLLVAFPGVSNPGSINVLSKNDIIGIDAWGSRNWYDDGCSSIDWLAGYQFTRLDDSIVINSALTAADPNGAIPVGTQISVVDAFRTQNEFHGGSIGMIGRTYRGPVQIEALAKIALGGVRQAVIINGRTTVGGTTSTGGFLAQASNIGSFERNRFAVSPELNVNLIYDLNESWRLLGGYSFIYWNNIVLAGNQLDTSLPVPFAAGGTQPEVLFQRTDYWVQGMSFGAEYRW